MTVSRILVFCSVFNVTLAPAAPPAAVSVDGPGPAPGPGRGLGPPGPCAAAMPMPSARHVAAAVVINNLLLIGKLLIMPPRRRFARRDYNELSLRMFRHLFQSSSQCTPAERR